MPIYEYTCPYCEPEVFYTHFAHLPPDPVPNCPQHDSTLKRVFSFSTPAMFQDGYDAQTGRYISSKRHHVETLKRLSDERTAATGIPHDYESLHPADANALNITEEARDVTYRRATEQGRREVKLYL